MTWNDNGTLSYVPKRTVVYIPEKSVGNPEIDLVSVPNIPMLVRKYFYNFILMKIVLKILTLSFKYILCGHPHEKGIRCRYGVTHIERIPY